MGSAGWAQSSDERSGAEQVKERDDSWAGGIVVTARKREERLQDIPAAITSISGGIVEDAFVDDVLDLQKLSPALSVDPGNDALGTNLRIRGVGANVFSTAVEPSVSVVVDGVVLARNSAATFLFNDIERIEVIRGPQGTLFGKNSTAGVVNVITKDPSSTFTGDFGLEQELDGPTDVATRVTAGLSGPVTDSIGFRLSAVYNNEPGFLEDVQQGGARLGDQETWGIRGKLVFDVSDNFTVELAGDYQDSIGDGRPSTQRVSGPLQTAINAGRIVASPENRQTFTLGGNQNDIENAGVALTMTLSDVLGGHELKSISAYRSVDAFAAVTAPPLGPLPGAPLNQSDRQYETYSQELTLNSAPGSFEYTLGMLYWVNNLDNDFDRQLNNLSGGAALLAQGYDNTVDTKNLGIYGQARWEVTDRFELTGGLRFIDEEVDVNFSSFRILSLAANGAVLSNTGIPITNTVVNDQHVTWMLATRYEVTPDVSVYASYSTGYKGRAFNLVTDTSLEDLQNPLNPETVDSFEVGLRTVLFGGSTIFNATGFVSVFENFQAQGGAVDLDGNIDLILTNAGELETKGVEVDFITDFGSGFSLFGAAAYTDATFTDFTSAPCFGGQTAAEGCRTGNVQDITGGVLPNAPEFKFSLIGKYETALGSTGFDGFATIGYRWQSDTQFQLNQNPTGIQDEFGIMDLTLGARNGSFEFAVFVRNLFDTNYVLGIGQNTFLASEGTGANRVLNSTQIVPRDASRIVGLRAGIGF
jgi:iron complex outermembrane receptor protein